MRRRRRRASPLAWARSGARSAATRSTPPPRSREGFVASTGSRLPPATGSRFVRRRRRMERNRTDTRRRSGDRRESACVSIASTPRRSRSRRSRRIVRRRVHAPSSPTPPRASHPASSTTTTDPNATVAALAPLQGVRVFFARQTLPNEKRERRPIASPWSVASRSRRPSRRRTWRASSDPRPSRSPRRCGAPPRGPCARQSPTRARLPARGRRTRRRLRVAAEL